jgi:hypothetical protein
MALCALGLVIVAVWFRCRCLSNVPGVNGDEAWYGVQAVETIRHGSSWVRTPTGNPVNPFFLGPLVLLHAWFPPSVVLLRSVAVASGLGALLVNWLLCRWVFDRATAAVSTVLLAVWPVSIVYSRFAWDASQSLLATLPVVYLSLATLRFPERRWMLVPATLVAIGVAVWVHPTNLFAGATGVATLGLWQRRARGVRIAPMRNRRKLAGAGLVLAVVLAGIGGVSWAFAGETAGRWLGRAGGLEDLTRRGGLWHVPALVARLHTGQTVYRYVPGSESWLTWSGAEGTRQWGVDVVLFWAALGAAGVIAWRSGVGGRSQESGGRGQEGREPRHCVAGAAERALLTGWALTLVAFLLVAGPSAMLPGWERYALCLIAPTTLLLARGAVLAFRAAGLWGQWALAAGPLLGFVLLADFQVHYFGFFRETGGRAHATFHTGPVEPKEAAVNWIAAQRPPAGDRAKPTWIITTEWWNYWPLRYLAADQPGLRVLTWEEAEALGGFRTALDEGRIFLVEFAGSPAEERALARAGELYPGIDPRRRPVRGYGEAPVLCVLHVR